MADFLFSTKSTSTTKPNNSSTKTTNNVNKPSNSNTNKTNKTPHLMFGGDYSNSNNNKKSEPSNMNKINNNQQTIPKKVPMFGNINKNVQNNNNVKKPPMPTFVNTKAYTVSNEENVKMLNELKGLIDYYIKEFSDEDKMKIGYLIDKLGKEV